MKTSVNSITHMYEINKMTLKFHYQANMSPTKDHFSDASDHLIDDYVVVFQR